MSPDISRNVEEGIHLLMLPLFPSLYLVHQRRVRKTKSIFLPSPDDLGMRYLKGLSPKRFPEQGAPPGRTPLRAKFESSADASHVT